MALPLCDVDVLSSVIKRPSQSNTAAPAPLTTYLDVPVLLLCSLCLTSPDVKRTIEVPAHFRLFEYRNLCYAPIPYLTAKNESNCVELYGTQRRGWSE